MPTTGMPASRAHSFSNVTHSESNVNGSRIVTTTRDASMDSLSLSLLISVRSERSKKTERPSPSAMSLTQIARSSDDSVRLQWDTNTSYVGSAALCER